VSISEIQRRLKPRSGPPGQGRAEVLVDYDPAAGTSMNKTLYKHPQTDSADGVYSTVTFGVYRGLEIWICRHTTRLDLATCPALAIGQ